MEALALATALFAAQVEFRDSEVLRCWSEAARFGTPPMALAQEHLSWLEARQEFDRDINPWIEEMIAEQNLVLKAYRLIETALARPFVSTDWDRLDELRQLIGDEDYQQGRLPYPVTCQRR